ncbi:AMP-binding protein [Pseudonocardia sp. TRM90224]|uniref:AMP-binding protein n=1 Tax=Pseudonocardia sp. TRM90224 TaxID=2812678 RepID=UPI001E4F3578|nr:AMP-binding protein [Pseudonocardia sp. TRM90224]
MIDALIARFAAPDACAAELLCDTHPEETVAFTVVERDLSTRNVTFGELRRESARFASALTDLGIDQGDAVGVLMGKSVELVVALLGIWRRGAVHVPLFTAFARPAISLRLLAAEAKLVVVDADQRGKLAAGEGIPAAPSWQLVVVGGEPGRGEHSFDALMAVADEDTQVATVGGDGPLVLLFTSGTTGDPKGVAVPLRAVASFVAYLELGLDVRTDDVYWNAADPGWAYGLYYAIIAPLAAGRRSVLLRAGFSAPLTWQVLERLRVTNLAAAPTVYRALAADADGPPAGLALRRASSAGEPLTPDVVEWSAGALGVEVRDHYGQTEHGMVIANGWADEVRADVLPGSMGRTLPGWSTAVLADDSDQPAPPGVQGRVAIDVPGSPLLWFGGYAGDPERTAARYTADGRWYLTGDAGSVDENGYYFFSSRDDDVIIMAGYRIGPFEVESVLVQHEAVAEAAVVGMPDPLRGEVLEAFVVLKPGTDPGPGFGEELRQLVKTRFAAHAYPRTVHIVDSLPKTPSGKVQRYVLRGR